MGLLDKLRQMHAEGGDSSETTTNQEDSSPRNTSQTATIESRILRTLVDNNGRIKKSRLLTEMDINEAKVQEKLNTMQERDEVRMIHSTNHILICRPGYEPPGQQQY